MLWICGRILVDNINGAEDAGFAGRYREHYIIGTQHFSSKYPFAWEDENSLLVYIYSLKQFGIYKQKSHYKTGINYFFLQTKRN